MVSSIVLFVALIYSAGWVELHPTRPGAHYGEQWDPLIVSPERLAMFSQENLGYMIFPSDKT